MPSSAIDRYVLYWVYVISIYALISIVIAPVMVTGHDDTTLNATIDADWSGNFTEPGATGFEEVGSDPVDYVEAFLTFHWNYRWFDLLLVTPMGIYLVWILLRYIKAF